MVQCSTVEKADLQLLSDPASFEEGMTFFRVDGGDDEEGGGADLGRLPISFLSTISKRKAPNHKKSKNKELVSNAVCHFEAGQVAYHLRQLEHMTLYSPR